MIHLKSSEGSRPLNSKDVNKNARAGKSTLLNSETILKTDSPRTCNLKSLRAKRLAYFVNRKHNCTNSSTADANLGFDDQQVTIDHTNSGQQSENVLKAEQNIYLPEKELDINELVQRTKIQDAQKFHDTNLKPPLRISKSDDKATSMPKPDYHFLENPTVSEIQKLRHILCWAQKILKKGKEVSNTQVYQNTLTINETELAESHLNPDISQPTTFNWSSSTKRSIHSGAASSRFDNTNYSSEIAADSCSYLDFLRPSSSVDQTSSFTTTLTDVQEQCTSTNTGYSSNHYFDSNNILDRKYSEQVNAYDITNENCHSVTSDVSGLKSDNYFWIPLEEKSDDKYVTENRPKKVSVEHFVKSNNDPLLCNSYNHYHQNNSESISSTRTIIHRKSPITYYSSEVLASPDNQHDCAPHYISSKNGNNNNNWEPTLSARTVILRKAPVTHCYSSADILANPVNLHNAAQHSKLIVYDKERHNYAWEAERVEQYSGGYQKLSLEDSNIADIPGDSLNLADAGFNLKSSITLTTIPTPCKGMTESSNIATTINAKENGTKLVRASQENSNSGQLPEKCRNLCIINSDETSLAYSSISQNYCGDIILDKRGSENLPTLESYLSKKETNCNNEENKLRHQIAETRAQSSFKLSSVLLPSLYEFNDSIKPSLYLEKEEPTESERGQITEESCGSFLTANNLVKICPECKSGNSSTVNWCTECGCVLIGIPPLFASNVDGRAFTNPRDTPNKEEIDMLVALATERLKESTGIVEPEIYDFKDSEDSTCFSSELCEPQLSVYERYLLYMENLEKLRGPHQTNQQQQTDILPIKGNTKQTETIDEDNSSYGKHELENSITTSFRVSTDFPDQTYRKYAVYEQDSEDNSIPALAIGTISSGENVPGFPVLHCGFQEKKYLQQKNNDETSKNISHGVVLKQNRGNQDLTSLEYENNKETFKDAEKRPKRRKNIQASINRYQRCWEKSSIAWSSYTHGGTKTRSIQINHSGPIADCQGKKGKPLPHDGPSAVKMMNSKGPGKQHIKRPLSANILDNKQAPQGARKSKIFFQNATVAGRPTTKPREISTSFRNNASQSCDKLNSRGDDNHSPWLYLPDEMWIRVFTLLPHRDLCQVAQVCYCFHRLANDETLWKNIKVENSNCLNDEWLKNIGHHQPQSLSLCRCNDRTKSITDSGLRELFRRSKDSLKELYVTCCSGPKLTGDSILLHASAVCHKLTSVDVSWTAATDAGIIALAHSSSCLYRLLVNGCHLTDESINILIKKHGKSLKELELFGCHELNTHCLTHMAQECLNLQILNIGRIPKLTMPCLIQIVTSLKNLRALYLSGLNAVCDSVVHHTARQCPKMDRLILSSCPQLTDISLFEIGTYLSTIRYLDVSGCKKVTDTGVQAIALSCRKLQYLDLSSTGTGKYGICLLASYCNQNLECVKLSFCKEITEDALKKLCRNCKQLKLVHLYGCQSVHNLKAIQAVNKQVKLHHDLPPCSAKDQEC
ncbi:uncharacterized protein LOC129695746 isoform X2 [Leucoraja erinacea]|nr:uncharacterized protein LOC129695746 isoform X2 [Leucoraja erinacea]XP_055488963.1 uncharacterized protein LOC129695746 isoform X2 [Leucoraja erinacea]XP_055488964.1 uncharacterized protein LOC129695746 isoform X2 [Leucoraja erinacea]